MIARCPIPSHGISMLMSRITVWDTIAIISTVWTAAKIEEALQSPSKPEHQSSETECGTRDDIYALLV